jgi:hypothetical protein
MKRKIFFKKIAENVKGYIDEIWLAVAILLFWMLILYFALIS